MQVSGGAVDFAVLMKENTQPVGWVYACIHIVVRYFRKQQISGEIISQLTGAARMPQASERFPFDLTYAFSCQPKLLPHFLKSVRPTVMQAKAEPQYARLARAERREDLFDFGAEKVLVGALCRSRCGFILNEGSQLGILLLPNGSF